MFKWRWFTEIWDLVGGDVDVDLGQRRARAGGEQVAAEGALEGPVVAGAVAMQDNRLRHQRQAHLQFQRAADAARCAAGAHRPQVQRQRVVVAVVDILGVQQLAQAALSKAQPVSHWNKFHFANQSKCGLTWLSQGKSFFQGVRFSVQTISRGRWA